MSSLPDISKWNTKNVTIMDLLFYNCSSLSSLPDISKWKINNVTSLNLMFAKCTSLISIPDISKWKTKSLKEMYCLFSDCYMMLFPPDISKWKNYNEDILDEMPDYEKINNILNFTNDIISFSSSPGVDEIFKDKKIFNKETKKKYIRFYE